MISVANATIIGNSGNKPELRHTASGQPVCKIRVAVNQVWSDKSGNKQERTDWFSVVAWGRLAEISVEWIKRGTRVYAEGRLQVSKADDGREFTELVANKIQFENMVARGQEATPSEREEIPPLPPPQLGDESIPF